MGRNSGHRARLFIESRAGDQRAVVDMDCDHGSFLQLYQKWPTIMETDH